MNRKRNPIVDILTEDATNGILVGTACAGLLLLAILFVKGVLLWLNR